MAYTTIKKPSDYFNTKLYTGTGATHNITGVGFQPDWVWCKSRSDAYEHYVHDSVRGATKHIITNNSNAEVTNTNQLTSFDSDGFTLGNDLVINGSSKTFVSWNWLAGGTGSSNTDGSITSTVSVNTTSGFSIVSYTGTGANATVGHGLGVAPKMIIIKNRSSATQWLVYHNAVPATQFLYLSSSDAATTDNAAFNNTAPTSSVFSLGALVAGNQSGNDMIAYCFAEKKGFSKFGSYTGNGNADGTFVYTGFKPAFVLIKRSDGTPNWTINDTVRDPTNVNNLRLFPNQNVVESSGSDSMDMLSNGFKLRSTDGGNNFSGGTFIYMAFAEEPLVGDNPCTAR